MELFIGDDPRLMYGPLGYCLATFQSALQVLRSFSRSRLPSLASELAPPPGVPAARAAAEEQDDDEATAGPEVHPQPTSGTLGAPADTITSANAGASGTLPSVAEILKDDLPLSATSKLAQLLESLVASLVILNSAEPAMVQHRATAHDWDAIGAQEDDGSWFF